MKKIIITITIILSLIFLSITIIDISNNKNQKNILEDIINNTKLNNINYYNHYDEYYIVMDDNNLYSYKKNFNLLDKIPKEEICSLEYQIIYEDNQFMYLNDTYKNKKLIYEYYDIYKCNLINTISLGG